MRVKRTRGLIPFCIKPNKGSLTRERKNYVHVNMRSCIKWIVIPSSCIYITKTLKWYVQKMNVKSTKNIMESQRCPYLHRMNSNPIKMMKYASLIIKYPCLTTFPSLLMVVEVHEKMRYNLSLTKKLKLKGKKYNLYSFIMCIIVIIVSYLTSH